MAYWNNSPQTDKHVDSLRHIILTQIQTTFFSPLNVVCLVKKQEISIFIFLRFIRRTPHSFEAITLTYQRSGLIYNNENIFLQYLKSTLLRQPCEKLLGCPTRQLLHEGPLTLVGKYYNISCRLKEARLYRTLGKRIFSKLYLLMSFIRSRKKCNRKHWESFQRNVAGIREKTD